MDEPSVPGGHQGPSLSSAAEDYLKAIFELGGADVGTVELAGLLEVSPASVTGMLRRLADLRLVDHERYRGASLTPAGRKVALETIRHHRLLETYLKEALGYSWFAVHDEAEKLEHHISEEFEDRIAEALGHPSHDPHGDPIPDREGEMPLVSGRPLAELAPGGYVVTRVGRLPVDTLIWLDGLGVRPGVPIVLREVLEDGRVVTEDFELEADVAAKIMAEAG